MVQPAPSTGAPRTDHLDESAPAPPPAPRPDLTRDRDDWDAAPAATVAAAAAAGKVAGEDAAAVGPAPAATESPPEPDADQGPTPYDAGYDEPWPDNYDWEEEPRERSGALAILGFLGLGVLALLAGAVLASLWGGGVGQADPTPTPLVSEAPPSASATPLASAAPSASAVPSGSAEPSEGPIVFPDGFVADVQPCLPGSVGSNGCDSNGVSNAGAVDLWVGFQNGNSSDVIGAIIESPDGTTADGSIDLTRIGCASPCGGYTWFSFSNLDPGTYEVRITRNGELAASTTFEVT